MGQKMVHYEISRARGFGDAQPGQGVLKRLDNLIDQTKRIK
jgi:hypothetical protein